MAFEVPPAGTETEVQLLERQIAEVEKKIADGKKIVAQKMEAKYVSGELERAVPPSVADQKGFESPGHRTALRNMRSTEMIKAWYQHAPEIFELELLTETIMQGVWSDVRKSDQFDSGFKDRMRVKKRQYVRYSGDLTLGFDPNVTKRLHETDAYELDELCKLANKRLRVLGPDGEGPNGEGNYFTLFGRDFKDDTGKARNIGKEYQKLIEKHNTAAPEEKVEDSMSSNERGEVRFKAGQVMWNVVSQNLADNEFTLMPGSLRDLYVVMRNMDENKLGPYRDRDLDVKIPMVEFFIEQFKDEVLGVRQATKPNLELFTWFVNKGGQNFIPFSGIREDLTDWWEIIKSLLGRPGDARVQPSIYGYIQEKGSGGDTSKVVQHINELRAQKGLPEWKMDDTPFIRIGVTKGRALE